MDRYLSCSRDKTIKLWNLSNDRPEMNMVGHELVVTCIAMDSENNYLISGSRDNNLNLWDLRTGKLISNAHISRNLVKFSKNKNLFEMNFIKKKLFPKDNRCLLVKRQLNINSKQ